MERDGGDGFLASRQHDPKVRPRAGPPENCDAHYLLWGVEPGGPANA